MSVAAALGTSTIYPLQPAIADIARSLATGPAAVGTALAFGPIGYMFGLALLVPLVDRFSPRRVLALQFLALGGALTLTAAAGTVWQIGLGMLLTGACSAVGAGLSSVVGRLAPEHRRSTILGIVTAGISAGILAGRIVGGWLTDVIGWHAMLLTVAVAAVGIAGACLLFLPTTRGAVEQNYLAGLASTPGLLPRNPVLRRGAVRGSLWFFAFCAVWSGIAVAAQVANQTAILAIDPAAPARFNSAYMLVYFVGGSLGTAFGAAAVASFGWSVTVVTCAAALLVAALLTRPGYCA